MDFLALVVEGCRGCLMGVEGGVSAWLEEVAGCFSSLVIGGALLGSRMRRGAVWGRRGHSAQASVLPGGGWFGGRLVSFFQLS